MGYDKRATLVGSMGVMELGPGVARWPGWCRACSVVGREVATRCDMWMEMG